MRPKYFVKRLICFGLIFMHSSAMSIVANTSTQNTKAMKEDSLIPREILFGNPDHISPKISSDGTTISYLAPHKDVMNVWVAPRGSPFKTRGKVKFDK